MSSGHASGPPTGDLVANLSQVAKTFFANTDFAKRHGIDANYLDSCQEAATTFMDQCGQQAPAIAAAVDDIRPGDSETMMSAVNVVVDSISKVAASQPPASAPKRRAMRMISDDAGRLTPYQRQLQRQVQGRQKGAPGKPMICDGPKPRGPQVQRKPVRESQADKSVVSDDARPTENQVKIPDWQVKRTERLRMQASCGRHAAEASGAQQQMEVPLDSDDEDTGSSCSFEGDRILRAAVDAAEGEKRKDDPHQESAAKISDQEENNGTSWRCEEVDDSGEEGDAKNEKCVQDSLRDEDVSVVVSECKDGVQELSRLVAQIVADIRGLSVGEGISKGKMKYFISRCKNLEVQCHRTSSTTERFSRRFASEMRQRDVHREEVARIRQLNELQEQRLQMVLNENARLEQCRKDEKCFQDSFPDGDVSIVASECKEGIQELVRLVAQIVADIRGLSIGQGITKGKVKHFTSCCEALEVQCHRASSTAEGFSQRIAIEMRQRDKNLEEIARIRQLYEAQEQSLQWVLSENAHLKRRLAAAGIEVDVEAQCADGDVLTTEGRNAAASSDITLKHLCRRLLVDTPMMALAACPLRLRCGRRFLFVFLTSTFLITLYRAVWTLN